MILAGLRKGDVVQANVRGFPFAATIVSVEPGQVWVDPPRGVTYRLLSARQIVRKIA